MIMSKTKILWLVILFLLTINVVTIITGFKYASKEEEPAEENIVVPLGQRVNFFRDQLGLTQEQRSLFMEAARNFNQEAVRITGNIKTARFGMYDEMAKSEPDAEKLDELAAEIGDLHRQLKESTIVYYMDLKNVCNEAQQERLHRIFITMANPEGDVNMFVRGRGLHRGKDGMRGPGAGRFRIENNQDVK
jgi:uncharacterized membrane protein